VSIPPLRERKEDIPPLAKRFLAKFSALNEKKLLGFSDKAKRALLDYPWPGNIREMQNMIERGVILAPQGERVEIEHLFTSYQEPRPKEIGLDRNGALDVKDVASVRRLCESVLDGAVSLDEIEAMMLEAAVDKAHGNLSSAARMLGITRPRMAYRLKRLHADDDGGDAAAPPTPASSEDAPAKALVS
jgi:two-component system, NtrC family, response regulator HydG